MRKLSYLGFCLVLALGVGCAVTDYPVITDNDQLGPGGAQPGGFIVNTNGKAHIIEQTSAAWLYGDGHHEEGIAFVDQNSAGDQTITNYINFSLPGDATFHDDTYCNPDWNGCAFWTADNPVTGDVNVFDGTHNLACFQGRAGWGVKVSASRSAECGRTDMNLADQINFYAMGQLGNHEGMEGLFYILNRQTSNAWINGQAFSFPSTSVFLSPGSRRAVISLDSPVWSSTMRRLDALVGQDPFSLRLDYNGISVFNGEAPQFAFFGQLRAD
jgi:hypothetical protein